MTQNAAGHSALRPHLRAPKSFQILNSLINILSGDQDSEQASFSQTCAHTMVLKGQSGLEVCADCVFPEATRLSWVRTGGPQEFHGPSVILLSGPMET